MSDRDAWMGLVERKVIRGSYVRNQYSSMWPSLILGGWASPGMAKTAGGSRVGRFARALSLGYFSVSPRLVV